MNIYLRAVAIGTTVAVTGVSWGASLFSGSAFFSIAPNSQMGSSVNQLNLNNGPNGFTVAGQFQVSVGAGAVTGTLLHYQVKRLLNPNFGSQTMNLFTQLVGFSAPPGGGTYSGTSGFCSTYLDISGQPAYVPLNLVNGAATWNVNVLGNSFNYVSGTDVYLVQEFMLDGSKLSGPAGTWVVDLPVESSAVPEPACLGLLVIGVGLCRRRRC